MNINLTATYNLDDEQILALFWNSLCSGSIGYGSVALDCDSSETYDTARENVKILKAQSPEDYVKGDYYICREDVWTELLRMGKLQVLEYDDWTDENELKGEFGLDDLYHNLNEMQRNEPWILNEFAEGNDDANTHDAFLQCALLGDIIYG
jgi:hypothetical protein